MTFLKAGQSVIQKGEIGGRGKSFQEGCKVISWL